MGRVKQLLPLEDRPLLQHVVDTTAASCLDEIILVLGHHAEEIREAIHCPTRVRVVVNADYAEGQSTSLRAGLSVANPDAAAVAVLLGDQPRVTAQLIDRMATAFTNSAACVVRPVYAGVGGHGVPGHPVFWARRVWPYIHKLRGDQEARALLRTHPEWLFEVAVEGDAPRDVDTWEDYQYSVGCTAPSTTRATADNLRGRA
jgi:molybdenum cofactor cytidylyltransferase